MNSIQATCPATPVADHPQLMLTKAEHALIAFVRGMGYGRIEIHVVNGEPVMIERAVEKIKLI